MEFYESVYTVVNWDCLSDYKKKGKCLFYKFRDSPGHPPEPRGGFCTVSPKSSYPFFHGGLKLFPLRNCRRSLG